MIDAPSDISARQAAEALDELARLRLHARRAPGRPYFPLLWFGVLTTLSAPLVAVAGLDVLLPFWVVAGTAGLVVVARHYRGRALRQGVMGRGRRVWAIAMAFFVGGVTAGVGGGRWGGERGAVLAPVVVVAAAYLVLGWFRRDPATIVAIVPAVVVAAGMIGAGSAPWLIELVLGAAITAAGGVLRAVERRS